MDGNGVVMLGKVNQDLKAMGKTGKRSRAGKEEPAGRKPGEPLSRPLVDMRGVASRLRASSRMGGKKNSICKYGRLREHSLSRALQLRLRSKSVRQRVHPVSVAG